MVSPWGWELYLFGSPQNPQSLAQFLIQGGTLQIIIRWANAEWEAMSKAVQAPFDSGVQDSEWSVSEILPATEIPTVNAP